MHRFFVLLLFVCQAYAQFFHDFFGGHQQQAQKPKKSYEDEVLNNNCQDYICPDTRDCVKKPIDCACPFPRSQLKCILPDNKNYVCISKPATLDKELIDIYDDPVKGPKTSISGQRDCGWVLKAYNGLV